MISTIMFIENLPRKHIREKPVIFSRTNKVHSKRHLTDDSIAKHASKPICCGWRITNSFLKNITIHFDRDDREFLFNS